MELKGKKMVFLGDSITEGAGVEGSNNIYWQRLQQDGAITVGYGIGGTRIAKQINPTTERHDMYFRSRVVDMDSDADVVVVFGGTNDYGHGDASFGEFDDRTDGTFYGALHNLYIDLLRKYPESQIVVMTPLHRLNECSEYNECGVRNVGTLEDYVEAIKQVARYYAIPVLDLYNMSGLQPEVESIRERFVPDGLHPSDAGHEKIYNLLKGFLKSL